MTRPAMTIERAREILGDAVDWTGGILPLGDRITFYPGLPVADLDGEFFADELEAIACVMRAGERKE